MRGLDCTLPPPFSTPDPTLGLLPSDLPDLFLTQHTCCQLDNMVTGERMVFTWESSTARSKTELGSILSGYRSTPKNPGSSETSWNQKQESTRNLKDYVGSIALSFIFTFLLQTALSVVLFRSTASRDWLAAPGPISKPQRGEQFFPAWI